MFVLAGMSPSESLASSLSVTVAKRSTEGRGCIRNELTDGCGSSTLGRCGLKLTTLAIPGQFVHEHMPRQVGTSRRYSFFVVASHRFVKMNAQSLVAIVL